MLYLDSVKRNTLNKPLESQAMTTETFNMLFVGLKDRAMHFAWSITGNRDDAQDAVQDLYEKLWRRRLLIRENGFNSLVMSSIKNICIDRMRKTSTEDIDAARGLSESGLCEPMLNETIHREIEHLPQREREAVMMHDVEQMEFDEIAELLGISQQSVRMSLSRGRSRLREKLTKLMNYGV